ncbi:MAG: hypothetical protein IT308_01440 [Anaerolineaceae bacterium]|nr:hypothetical protein [Anaerolineaceae bacterium]
MELEQIVKRLEWLDDERRKDKTNIATLEERIKALESHLNTVNQENKELASQTTRVTSMVSRFEQIDATLAQTRVEFSRAIEVVEKQRADYAREIEKIRRADQESVQKSIGELRKSLEAFSDLKKNMQVRIEEELRLSRTLEELSNQVSESQRSSEESRRIQKMTDESHRQDTKRLLDMNAEISTLRKRQDEIRGKLDVASDSLRKVELRLNELLAAETERRQAQNAFLERQNLQGVERDRQWKEWQEKFEAFSDQNLNLDSQIQAIESTHRAVKRSQEAFEEITQKYERRINEITEMQRLVEERFRQEWATFKSDDQKRWANYLLSHDEQQRDLNRQNEKQQQRLAALEDANREVQDTLYQANQETLKRLQDLLASAQRWTEDFENLAREAREL